MPRQAHPPRLSRAPALDDDDATRLSSNEEDLPDVSEIDKRAKESPVLPNVHADPPPPPATPPPPSTPSPAPSAQLEQSKQSPSTSSDPHSALKTVDGSRNDDNGQQSDASDGDDEANDEASTSGWATGIRFAMAGEYNKAAKDDVLGEIKSGGGVAVRVVEQPDYIIISPPVLVNVARKIEQSKAEVLDLDDEWPTFVKHRMKEHAVRELRRIEAAEAKRKGKQKEQGPVRGMNLVPPAEAINKTASVPSSKTGPIEIQEVQTAEEIPNDGDGARKLFEDQEGDPISFWLQVSIHEDIQKSLKKAIEWHGGLMSNLEEAQIRLVDPRSKLGTSYLDTRQKDDFWRVRPWHWVFASIEAGRRLKTKDLQSSAPIFITNGVNNGDNRGGKPISCWVIPSLAKRKPKLVSDLKAYGAVVKKNIANAHVLIYDEQNYDTTTEAILNEYSGKRSKTLAHYKWIQDSITSGNLAVLPEMKKKDKSKAAEGSRPAEVRKVNGRASEYSAREDQRLLNFIAEMVFIDKRTNSGQKMGLGGVAMCEYLCDNKAEYPWAKSHTALAWQQRYKRLKNYYNAEAAVKERVAKLARGERLSSKPPGEESGSDLDDPRNNVGRLLASSSGGFVPKEKEQPKQRKGEIFAPKRKIVKRKAQPRESTTEEDENREFRETRMKTHSPEPAAEASREACLSEHSPCESNPETGSAPKRARIDKAAAAEQDDAMARQRAVSSFASPRPRSREIVELGIAPEAYLEDDDILGGIDEDGLTGGAATVAAAGPVATEIDEAAADEVRGHDNEDASFIGETQVREEQAVDNLGPLQLAREEGEEEEEQGKVLSTTKRRVQQTLSVNAPSAAAISPQNSDEEEDENSDDLEDFEEDPDVSFRASTELFRSIAPSGQAFPSSSLSPSSLAAASLVPSISVATAAVAAHASGILAARDASLPTSPMEKRKPDGEEDGSRRAAKAARPSLNLAGAEGVPHFNTSLFSRCRSSKSTSATASPRPSLPPRPEVSPSKLVASNLTPLKQSTTALAEKQAQAAAPAAEDRSTTTTTSGQGLQPQHEWTAEEDNILLNGTESQISELEEQHGLQLAWGRLKRLRGHRANR